MGEKRGSVVGANDDDRKKRRLTLMNRRFPIIHHSRIKYQASAFMSMASFFCFLDIRRQSPIR
jgi:hypothetical protein